MQTRERTGGVDDVVNIATGSEDEEEQVPLLFVDVNLGSGRTDRIVLYDNDNPKEVALRFSKQHKLEEEMT